MASRFVEVEPGVRVWVKDVGEGRPMVFLHGWPASHRMFEYQFNELPKHGVRCLGIDTRGFGESDHPWGGYDYDRLADDVHAVLEAYSLRDVTLVGFSMGAATALRTASRFPNVVERLALLGAAAPRVTRADDFPFGVDRSACDELIRLAYRDRPRMLGKFAKMFFHAPEALSPEFRSWFQRLCEDASGRATIACCELFRDADLRPDLDTIECPTLVLHGGDDRVCTYEIAEQTHRGISGSQLVRVEAAGHGFFYEQRNRVNEELLKFMGLEAGVDASGEPIAPT